MPEPQEPHFIRPDNMRMVFWHRAPGARESAFLRACAACQISSATIRRCGASAVRNWSGVFGREMRRPVDGSLIMRTLFQTIRPIWISLRRRPAPHCKLPLMVEAFQVAPRGGLMPLLLRDAAISRGDFPPT